MARVISINPPNEIQVFHKQCGAMVGYMKSEAKLDTSHVKGDGETAYGHIERYITCPHCKRRIVIKSWEV